MTLKEEITSKFNKEKFKLLNCGTAKDGEWDGVDESIRDFLKTLNESENISTLYSCEGHKEEDHAYIYFNVDCVGWDIFWQQVMPELSKKFCFIHPEIPNGLYQVEWCVNVTDNEYNTGISINTSLINFEVKETGRILVPWHEKKEVFWSIVKETFLKHYK